MRGEAGGLYPDVTAIEAVVKPGGTEIAEKAFTKIPEQGGGKLWKNYQLYIKLMAY